MELLYIAYACQDIDGRKLLLPGYPVDPDRRRPIRGDKIKLQLADGTSLETTAQGTRPLLFDETLMMKLKLRVKSRFYTAIEVPHDFSAPGIELGANVSLMD